MGIRSTGRVTLTSLGGRAELVAAQRFVLTNFMSREISDVEF